MVNKAYYSEKLKDPRWQKKRLEIFKRDEFACRFCSVDDSTLHVHHLSYGKDPWDVPDEHLLTLCEECHQAEHDYRETSEKNLLKALRLKGISYDGLDILADAISVKASWHVESVEFATLTWMIQNPALMYEMSQRYLQSLNNREEQLTDNIPF